MTKYNDSVARGDEKAELPDCGFPRPVMRLGDGGFTLTEVMVVAGIIGLLVTLAIPNYLKGQPHMRLKAAARDVASAMQLARATAVSKNNVISVSFDLTNDTFVIQSRVLPSSWQTESNVSVHSGDWKDIDLHDPGTLGVYNTALFIDDGTSTRVKFRPDGSADFSVTGDAQQEMYLRNKKSPGEVYRVAVMGSTGLVKVQKLEGAVWK